MMIEHKVFNNKLTYNVGRTITFVDAAQRRSSHPRRTLGPDDAKYVIG